MALLIINTGTSANSGNGDSIRSAFTKVNQNFDYLEGIVLGTSTNFNSGARQAVRPMFVHDAHNGLTAVYNPFSDRIQFTVGAINFTATNITAQNLTVRQTATLYDVVMTGTVNMGIIQGFDDVNIIKFADDGSLNFRLKNTYGLGSSQINFLDFAGGSFNIIHQNSPGNNGLLSAGQNYIFDDSGRAINVGRNSNINFYSKSNFSTYTQPEFSITTTGTVRVSSTLTVDKTFFNIGGKTLAVTGTAITLDGQTIDARTDRLVSGDYTATLTTSGNLLLPGDVIVQYDRSIPAGQTTTNYGAVFSTDGPFAGVGSLYFDGSSRLEINGSNHFDFITGTYTIEWFQKPIVFNTLSEYTVFMLGTEGDQTLRGYNFSFNGIDPFISVLFEGEIGIISTNTNINTWSHVALVRDTSTVALYINGIGVISSNTNVLPTPITTNSNLIIGSSNLDNITYLNSFTGYISNMRWENRVVYTATFVPPTSILVASSSTKLLLATQNNSNYEFDTSGTAPSKPQRLSFVINNSSLILNEEGALTLNHDVPYQGYESGGTTFRIDNDQPYYTQIVTKNRSTGTTATSDLIFVRNDGDLDSGQGVLDIGINSSNYVEASPYGIHDPGSAYMFTNDADLVIGTQTPGTRLIFHAGGTNSTDSAGILDGYAWRFNRDVQVVVGTPGPLNFTVWNTQNNSAATAVYQAINNQSDFAQFGIMSSNPGAYDGNIAPRDGFMHIHTTATLHIGDKGNLAFYSEQFNGFNGTPTLLMSRFDRSSTFAGDILPDADKLYSLGSLTKQWKSLYVSTSTIFVGGVPITVNPANNTLVVGTSSNVSSTLTNLATEAFVIDYVALNGGGGEAGNTGDITFTGSTITTAVGDITIDATGSNVIIKTGIGTYTFAYDAMSSVGYLEIPFSIQGPEQTGFTTPSGYGISIDSFSSPANVDIGNVGGGKFLRVEDGTNPADVDLKGFGKITLRTDGDTGPLWTYDTNGSLTIPNDIHGSGANAVVVQNTASGVAYLELPVDPSTDDVILSNQDPGGVVTLRAGDFGLEKDWRFDANGQLNLPGGANIFAVNYSAAIRAGSDGTSTYGVVNIQTNNPSTTSTWSFGTQGEITLPGGGVIQENQITNELWGTTTTSLSLYPGGSSQVNQRLEIYSTGGGEGDHLHLTAGDQTSTDLFLGNDTQYFAVSSAGTNWIQARPGTDSPNTSTTANPGGSVNIFAGDAGDNGGDPQNGASGGDIYAQAGISSAGYGGNVYLKSGAGQAGYGSILLTTDGGSNSWIFDRDDNLTFPSGGSITFDNSATSYIYGVTGIEFANATTQTTAWVGGGSSISSTSFVAVNDINTGNFQNTGSVAINYTAFSGDPGVNFSIDYQSPLTTATGINVLAVGFPDNTTQTTAFTGTAALLDITNTNGLATTYYLTFVENRSNDQEVRADVDLTYETADNILGVGRVSVNSTTASTSTTTGALTVAGGVGVQGDIYAGNIYSNGVQLTAGGGGGASGVTSITAGTGTFVSTSTGNVVVWVGNTSNLEETFESKTTGTGVTVFDCTTNRLFYQTGLTGNITPNFTNLNLSTGEATSISIVVVQGGTARNISGIQVAGTTTGITLLWQGAASAPSGNASRTDVFTFSIMSTASNAYTILGMLTSFGGV